MLGRRPALPLLLVEAAEALRLLLWGIWIPVACDMRALSRSCRLLSLCALNLRGPRGDLDQLSLLVGLLSVVLPWPEGGVVLAGGVDGTAEP
jgi:hypothetical protein